MITRPTAVATTLALAGLTLTYCPAGEHTTLTSALVPASAAVSAVALRSAGFDRVQSGVVMLFASPRSDEMSAGPAIVVNSQGVALTNAHVVRDAQVIVAHSADGAHGGRNYPVKVLGSDDLHDIAVIRLTGSPAGAAELGDSDTVRVGQVVAAVGNVGGSGTATTTTGVITGLGRRVVSLDASGGRPERLRDMIETDAWVRPGDSGGPLIAASGAVIGIDTAADGRHGYAIAINDALSYAHQIARFDAQQSGPDTRTVNEERSPRHRGLLDARPQLGESELPPRRHTEAPGRRRPLLSHVTRRVGRR